MKFNRHKIIDSKGNHKFTIMHTAGRQWKKYGTTLHIGEVCVVISRDDAAKAIINSRKSGDIVESQFGI